MSIRFQRGVLPVFFLVFGLFEPAMANSQILSLTDDASEARLDLISEDPTGCDIRFELNHLTDDQVTVDGVLFHELIIEGGGLAGKDGAPGLPTYSGMIAVPAGQTADVEIVSSESREFPGIKIFPVQPEKAETFHLDPEAYRHQPGLRDQNSYSVDLGEPAILHGQPVVPFTIHPVNYRVEDDLVTIATRLRLRFRFKVDNKGKTSRRTFDRLPRSFCRFFDDVLINSLPSGKSVSGDAPGTYLVITPQAAMGSLAPLLDWRRRQGYNVVIGNTGMIGSNSVLIKNYIQNIYDTVDPPLEYVVMVGDVDGSIATPTFIEFISGYHGEGDHYYTTLDGDDILADVHIGRLSAQDPTELSAIVSKIITYETNPPREDDPDWFRRATLVGDPGASGMTTIYVNQWLKEQLEDLSFTQIDTVFGGNFPNQMFASINQGLSVFGYRGFYAMSGFNEGHILSLTNQDKLPFAVLPTCDTGSFRTQTTCRSEAFLRNPNGGAIGAIGMSTTGTHTRYNNCLYQGIWEEALNSDDHHLGTALSTGKLEVFNNYYLAEPDIAEIWAVWANLMGDPATDLWLDQPSAMQANYPTRLPVAASSVPVTVTSNGQPLPGVLVALYKDHEVRSVGVTDAAGRVNLPFVAQTAGTLRVTATRHNYLPVLGGVTLGSVDAHATLTDMTLDDDAGNGDQLANPGETLSLLCALTNEGEDPTGIMTAELISRDPLVTVIDRNEVYGNIQAGQTVWSQDGFQVRVSEQAEEGHHVLLDLVAINGAESWTSALEFTVRAPRFSVVSMDWGGDGGSPDPGEFGEMVLTLANTGGAASGIIQASLSTESPWVLVTDPTGVFGALEPGEQTNNPMDHFAIQIADDCFAGNLATFHLNLTLAGGLKRSATFQVTLGQTATTDPVGPDSHGYFAIDNTDTSYNQAPVYDWVEINPAHGGPGTDTGMSDAYFEQDKTEVFDLPFTFKYYGEEFDKISICTNGWMTMGATYLRHYRNFSIPAAGSPDALIAPFWDNLYTSGVNKVYYWYDETNGRFIVEWSEMHIYYNDHSSTAIEDFQAILYDPAVHPTSNGDGMILFQYATVNNADTENGYATVGIQNLAGDDGLLYTYWNEYAAGAAPLEAGRAILFTPGPDTPFMTCEVSPDHFTLTMEPNQTRDETLVISNNGDPGSELAFLIEKIDPDAPTPPPPGGAKDMTGSTLTCNLSVYEVGQTLELEFSASNNSPDNEYLNLVSLDFPSGVSVVSSTNLIHTSVQTLTSNQATGDGAYLIWSDGIITSGNTGVSTVTVDFSDFSGTLILPYTMSGDNYGGEPHTITGTIEINPSEASVSLLSPDGGELWSIGQEVEIEYRAGGGPGTLILELDRYDDGNWETILSGLPESDLGADWTVTGPISAQCRMRLSYLDDPSIFDISTDYFTIGRDLSWVMTDHDSGVIQAGTPEEVVLSFDTTGMTPGTYRVDLKVRQMANGVVTVPIELTIAGGRSGQAEFPLVTRLKQNHPNPFNPKTEIVFSLATEGKTRLRVFNSRGQLVKTLVDNNLESGEHHLFWQGRDDSGRLMSSGVYYYRLETTSGREVKKMVFLK